MKLILPLFALVLGGAALHPAGAFSVSEEVLFDGVAQPSRVVNLGAATDGLLAEVLVDRGDSVVTGQLLARLDVAVAEAEVALARRRADATASKNIIEARLLDVQRRLAQQEMLLADGFTTTELVDAIRTELRVEELNLAKEEEQVEISVLEHRRAEALSKRGMITSPIDGIVLERFLSPGEILSKGGQAEVLKIAQLDPLFVELHVPIDMFDELAVGDSAQVYLDAPGEPRAKATVTIKDHMVDTASRTFSVRLELPNPGLSWPAGLRCRVAFER